MTLTVLHFCINIYVCFCTYMYVGMFECVFVCMCWPDVNNGCFLQLFFILFF